MLPNQFVHAANVVVVHVDERVGRSGDGRRRRRWRTDGQSRGAVVARRRRVRQQTRDVFPGDHSSLRVDAQLTEKFVEMLLRPEGVVVDRVDAEKDAQRGARFPRFDHRENRRQLQHVQTSDIELCRRFRKDEIDLERNSSASERHRCHATYRPNVDENTPTV